MVGADRMSKTEQFAWALVSVAGGFALTILASAGWGSG
jgi:hypothetical protein